MTIPDALDAVVTALRDADLPATRDAGAFYPNPIGVLVGMPNMTTSGLGSRTLEVPVHVVSAEPPTPRIVGLMYAAADTAARALSTDTYEASTFAGGVNSEPLPAINLNVTVTIPYETPTPED